MPMLPDQGGLFASPHLFRGILLVKFEAGWEQQIPLFGRKVHRFMSLTEQRAATLRGIIEQT
jgi:hypothetical protein